MDRVLSPGEVAKIFRVDPKTVSRWADQGLIPYFRTVGGHHRFLETDVMNLLNKETNAITG